MPVRAIFLLLLHLIDFLQWVKTDKLVPQISCRSWVSPPPLAVPQQQQQCCNRKKVFSLVLRFSVHVPCPKEGWIADMAEHAKVVTVIEITLHKLGSGAYAIFVEIPRQFRCDWLQVVGMQCLQFHILPQHIWAHFPVLPLGWGTTLGWHNWDPELAS